MFTKPKNRRLTARRSLRAKPVTFYIFEILKGVSAALLFGFAALMISAVFANFICALQTSCRF